MHFKLSLLEKGALECNHLQKPPSNYAFRTSSADIQSKRTCLRFFFAFNVWACGGCCCRHWCNIPFDLTDVLCVGYSMGVQSCRSCLAIASSSKRKKRSDYFLSLALSRSSWVFFTFGGGEIFSLQTVGSLPEPVSDIFSWLGGSQLR